ncbi:MAG: IS21 family transposase [Peptostreptococcaceae bacterium]|nr:IS21 family transposase [Peptostreptococcaceae bacterium]
MIIDVEVYEQIRYLYEQEGLSQRNIAKKLGISRTTVKKYYLGETVPWERNGTSGRDPYMLTSRIKVFIQSCLEEDETHNIKKQKHTARRIHERLVEDYAFTGGESTIRNYVASLKPEPTKVFIPLSYEPGEAIQIDWGEATVFLNGKKIKINLFCMRQCYSADIFVIAFYKQNEESFLEGIAEGLKYFGGSSARMIFDNAKVAVKEGFGSHAVVQNRYKALSAHYAFKTDFCNIAAGHEKGLVEGLVGYIRRNALVPIPRVETIEALNDALFKRCIKYRNHKIKGRDLTVGEMFHIEKNHFISLPKYPFDTSRSITKKVGEFSLVTFDRSSYSVPFIYCGKDITIKGYGTKIMMFYRMEKIAEYDRVYKCNSVNYRLEHYIDLIEKRPRSVYNAKPVKETLSAELLAIGNRLSGPKEVVQLLRLCIDQGEDAIIKAVQYLSPSQTISIEAIKSSMIVPSITKPLVICDKIKVIPTNLSKYDTLIRGGIAL